MAEKFEILYSAKVIQKRIKEMGKQITQDYQGKELVVVGVLKGAFVFMSDLVRAIDLPMQCEFLRIASYGTQKVSSGEIKMSLDVKAEAVKGKHILLVEDIVDSGNSIVFLNKHLQQYGPASIKVCCFLFKEKKLEHQVTLDYVGFKIEPAFVIGYGLDLAEKYRNLPDVAIHPS